MIKHLIYVRHGQTDWNVKKRIQGHSGGPLNGIGFKQAHDLGKRFRHISLWHPEVAPIGRIISSDSPRATDTATVLADYVRGGYLQDDRLRECCFGSLEGLTYQEAVALHGPEILAHLEKWDGEYDFQPFGGECKQQVLNRQVKLLHSIVSGSDIPTVAFVGSGRSGNTFIKHFWPKIELIVDNCDYRVLKM